jgi:hypothetical protein
MRRSCCSGKEGIGATRDAMKHFATTARFSHYWEIDDNVIGFVARPERRHVSMREALLHGQRLMLHGRGEGVAVVGFDCWKGLDEIRAGNELFVKVNGLATSKVRASVSFNPCLVLLMSLRG